MIVLDTHIFLWYILDDARLSPLLRADLMNDPTSVFVPSVCFWEAMLLAEKGRVSFGTRYPDEVLRSELKKVGFKEVQLSNEMAIFSRTLPFDHEDPADRFIAATAYALRARLATSDSRLRSLPWVRLAY